MFSDRWKTLGEVIEKCAYTTPNRQISCTESFQLFHAFLLQVRECSGMVYIIQSGESRSLGSHFADKLMSALQILARGFIHQDLTFPLSIPFKKSDLFITICLNGRSAKILGIASMAKKNDIPLITLTGGHLRNLLLRQGDLNLYFSGDDENLIATAQYFLLKRIIDAWTFDSLSFPLRRIPPAIGTKSQNLATGLRI